MTLQNRVLLEGLKFPEGPRWHEGKFWFSDMNAYRVMTVDLDGNAAVIVEVPGCPSGLGWLPDGRLLVVSMIDRRLLRLDPEGLVEVADLSGLASGSCNDMVVDDRGRAYIGHFGGDLRDRQMTPAQIILVTPEGNAGIVAEDLYFPNGSVITADGVTLIVAETGAARLTAFDIEPDGSLTGRRVWAQLDEVPQHINTLGELADSGIVGPDGICLDAEGAIWVANPFSREILRVHEGGEVSDRISLSTPVTACMLGGPERRTLFITTPEHPGPDNSITSGTVEIIQVAIPGAGLP